MFLILSVYNIIISFVVFCVFFIRDSPYLEGQITVFISPSNRVARLYPQTLGSLSVASYDSQGYGGGIRPRLHNGMH
jgi:hypothetical protein